MIDGIVLIDKPQGWTSFDVVKKLRGLTRCRRVGHAGTLDPMATGLLAVLFGKATKIAARLLDGDKGYIGEMTLGLETDSLDSQGRVTSTKQVPQGISEASLKEVFSRFTGPIEQLPPMVSAKHHKGQRLYDLARNGITVERKPSPVTIHELSLRNFTPGEFPKVEFYCRCSKGTYIRSLASDIGSAIGCGAHLSALRRVYSHPFRLEDALPLIEAEKLIKAGEIDRILLDPEKIGR